MRINRHVVAGMGAVATAAILAACADSPTSPASRTAFVPKASFAVGDPVSVAPPNATELRICKAGDVGGTINITDVGNGTGGGGTIVSVADQNGAVAGIQVAMTPGAGGAANCILALTANGNATIEAGDFFTVTETVGAGVTSVKTCYLNDGNAVADTCPAQFFVNTAHGWTVVFTNTAPPPPPRCTYTKGWYQSKHATDGEDRDIIAGVEGLSVADQYKIFNATPGKLGDVELDGPNSLLNLYQQLLAALNNLNNNEDAGPNAVDAAIDAAQDGTSITAGLTISTTLTNAQISNLTNTLSSFNEGAYLGFPHCDDEILTIE